MTAEADDYEDFEPELKALAWIEATRDDDSAALAALAPTVEDRADLADAFMTLLLEAIEVIAEADGQTFDETFDAWRSALVQRHLEENRQPGQG